MTSKEIKSAEAKAGRKAAKMAEAYLLQLIRNKLNIHNKGFPEGPILEDTVVKMKMGEYRLLGLNLQTSKAGYILNYGFVGVRNATKVYYKAARYKVSSAQRKSHSFKLPAQEIFEDFYQKSGAIDYLMAELAKTRGEGFQSSLNKMALQFNTHNNEQ